MRFPFAKRKHVLVVAVLVLALVVVEHVGSGHLRDVLQLAGCFEMSGG
jgi:hypothetical protein